MRPNHVSAIDFQFDETTDQRRLKLANVVDEYTREALAMRVGRSCTADDLLVELDRLVALYGPPTSLQCDNGPAHRQLVARLVSDVARRDQLHRTGLTIGRTHTSRASTARVRDELLNIEDFATLLEAEVVVEAWQIEYNTNRLHGRTCTFPRTRLSTCSCRARPWWCRDPSLGYQ